MLMDAIIRRRRLARFSPAALFGTTDTGWLYDLSDMSTLFQDAAGTTPVTAVGQPVGLQLDKTKGLVLGPELVTNGDFSNGTTGWVAGPGGTISVSGGQLTGVSGGASNIVASQAIAAVIGRTYEIRWEVVSVNAGTGSFVGFGGAVTTIAAGSGARVARITATTTGQLNFFGSGANSSVTIDNISVRELPGNHSSQSTPSFRGVLQGSPSRLVLDGSDDRYVTTLNPTASGTIAARIRGATASRVVAGSQGATDGRALLALAADGSIAAGIGAQSTVVIKGTVDKRNVWVTACVTWNGTTVRLYEDGVEVYSGAQSGAVNTTVPFIYGALNANGTATAFWDDDIGASLVISRAITATEAVQLHNAWRNIA